MTPSPSSKRRKATRACDSCRAQKKRCTGTIPCASCVRNYKKCTFLALYTRGRPVTPPPSSTSVASPSVEKNLGSTTSPVRHYQPPRSSSHSTPYVSSDQSFERIEDSSLTQNGRSWTSMQSPAEPLDAPYLQDQDSEPTSDEVLPDGHFVGPGSAHSWLKQAWSCLGRVRQHVNRLHSTRAAINTNGRTDGSIFSHGDEALQDDQLGNAKLPRLSAHTLELITATYFDRATATYRYLHRPTVTGWLYSLQAESGLPPVQSAVVLLLLALGSCYLSEADKAQLPATDAETLQNETLFYQAQRLLNEETGPPSVESVQARLMQVHYLLSSSRPNGAWYAFGTVIQLVFALGLHQKSYTKQNTPGLSRELRRRAFWSVYRTDKTLSIALGRPSLIREECITQELPETVNDDQILTDRIKAESEDDCLMEADILQIKLAKIVGRGMKEYYETNDSSLIRLIMANNKRLADWRAQIPPLLSGTIKASSLIPVLRRQATVLKLFHLHTIIFINRPLLLKSFSNSLSLPLDQQIQSNIHACINAASDIAKQAVQFNLEGQAFRAFWFSQNMTFNAVSIIYLNSLRLLQGESILSEDEHERLSVAEEAQKSLTNASKQNAPGQRYGIVLEQLRLEVQAHLTGNSFSNSTAEPSINDADDEHETAGINDVNGSAELDWTNLISETPLDDASMFWPQFDGLPLGFDEWLGGDFVSSATGLPG